MPRYNPKEVEPKWRAAWAEAQVFRAETRNWLIHFIKNSEAILIAS